MNNEKLEKAKRLYETANKDQRYVLESLFPELKESEDERIKKTITAVIGCYDSENSYFREVSKKKCLAWIEKQGQVKESDIFQHEKITCKENGDSLTLKKDERIRKTLLDWLKNSDGQTLPIEKYNECVAWLEKQKDIDSKEYVFRPLVGCDINTAAIQAVEQQKLGNKIVLTFNGAYIPVEGKTADDIVNEYYSWLEKQSEQEPQGKTALEAIKKEKVDNQNCVKPSDNLEPKFKVGDWVVQENVGVYKAIEICESWYEVIDTEDYHYSISFDNEYMCRLWDITKDAKDGDVLCVKYGNDEMPFIFTGKQGDVAYCALNSFGEFVLSMAEWLLHTSVLPATKEQRDLLFFKMHEAGYEWDAKEKELKKIHIIDEGKAEMDYCFTKMMNGEKVSPAWSEEDE